MRNGLIKVSGGLTIILALGIAAGAQDFSFSTSDGSVVPLSSFRGNVVILFFSGSQDPQRRDGLKALQDLAERQKGKNVKVCWVSVNPATEMANDQLRSLSSAAPLVSILRDTNQAAFKRFSGKVAQLPTVVVLDRQSAPYGQPRGGFNPNSDFINDLSSLIDVLLKR